MGGQSKHEVPNSCKARNGMILPLQELAVPIPTRRPSCPMGLIRRLLGVKKRPGHVEKQESNAGHMT